MKPLWISSALLLLLVLAGSFNSALLSQFQTSLDASLNASCHAAEKGSWQTASAALNEAKGTWEEYEFYLHIISDHSEIGETELLFEQAQVFLLQNDFERYQLSIASLLLQITHLQENQQCRWRNIL